MDARTLQVLEFPKILACLAGFSVSEAGGKACRAMRPFSHVEEVHFQNTFFEQGCLWLELTGFHLTGFPSLEGVFSFLESSGQSLDMDGLWILRQVLEQGKNLLASMTQDAQNALSWPLLLEFLQSRPLPQKSTQALGRCISDDGILRDEAAPDLALARTEIRRIYQQCSRKVGDFIRQYNLAHYLQDEYMTLASDRYVLPLKTNFKGKFQGIIHDYSQTGETCYFEPLFLVDLNNRLQEFKRDEREAERKVYAYLSDLLRSEREALNTLYNLLITVDVLQARRCFAESRGGVLVRLGEDLPVYLREVRHPLLIPIRAEGSAGQPVPVDIILENGQKTLIISGGNAGGKTVCLKTLGIIALMSMCSIPVPAAPGSTLPFWRHIVPFIGDDQSLEDHLSTFTAQIAGLTSHWERLGPDSLVILDEFGAGTDPSQGAALAQAVIDMVMEKGASIFAATHFPALKAYALSRPGVRAASVLFDPRTKKPLFRLVYDQVGASRALDVAREHGLPEEVLKKAQQYLLMDGEDSSRLLDRLNSLAADREKEAEALKKEQEAYHRKRKSLEDRFIQEKQQLFAEVRDQAQEVLHEWKAARLSSKQALKNLARVRTNLLQDMAGKESVASVNTALDLNRVAPGASLLYLPWNKSGVVLETDKRKNRVRLDLSGVTMWTEASDLALPMRHGDQVSSKVGGTGVFQSPAASVSLRLDLRGSRIDAALAELASFIDTAVLKGREQLEILHGRGTGALRREIHAYIKQHPQVRSFELAAEDQGGDGITLIFLK